MAAGTPDKETRADATTFDCKRVGMVEMQTQVSGRTCQRSSQTGEGQAILILPTVTAAVPGVD